MDHVFSPFCGCGFMLSLYVLATQCFITKHSTASLRAARWTSYTFGVQTRGRATWPLLLSGPSLLLPNCSMSGTRPPPTLQVLPHTCSSTSFPTEGDSLQLWTLPSPVAYFQVLMGPTLWWLLVWLQLSFLYPPPHSSTRWISPSDLNSCCKDLSHSAEPCWSLTHKSMDMMNGCSFKC